MAPLPGEQFKSFVAVTSSEVKVYPDQAPFHPGEVFPEYPWPAKEVDRENEVYGLVRSNFHQLGLDKAHMDSDVWNPLGEFILPGQTVLIKPNMVLHEHIRGGDLDCLITHGSVIRPILDYVCLALKGEGRIIVGDSPLQGTDFELSAQRSGIAQVVDYMATQTSCAISLVDFRQVHATMDERYHVAEWQEVPGDPSGYVEFALNEESMLAPLAEDTEKFRVSNYKPEDTRHYHQGTSHRYVITASVPMADVIINVPKLKTHCKAGVTLAMKNFVGTVGRKQCLAHHRHGSALLGGDEYPDRSRLKAFSVRLEDLIDGRAPGPSRQLLKFLFRVIERLLKTFGISKLREGAWHGNDTVWRMVHDLVRIAMYGKEDGTLDDTPQRVIFSLLDGVVAGENEGPLECTEKPIGTLISGFNPLWVDRVGSMIMGFDPDRIPLLQKSNSPIREYLNDGLVDVKVVTNNNTLVALPEFRVAPRSHQFIPSKGWMGQVEL